MSWFMLNPGSEVQPDDFDKSAFTLSVHMVEFYWDE